MPTIFKKIWAKGRILVTFLVSQIISFILIRSFFSLLNLISFLNSQLNRLNFWGGTILFLITNFFSNYWVLRLWLAKQLYRTNPARFFWLVLAADLLTYCLMQFIWEAWF